MLSCGGAFFGHFGKGFNEVRELRWFCHDGVDLRWDVAFLFEHCPPPGEQDHGRCGRFCLDGLRDLSAIDVRHTEVGNDDIEWFAALLCRLEGIQARLAALWRAAVSGQARLALVTGEAGVGKTRLVDELRADAGAVTVEARAYPAEGTLAYGVAAAWLRCQAVAARMPRLDRPDLTELARLLPELAAHVPPPEPLPEPELRRRLFEAITRALLAAGEPLLLIEGNPAYYERFGFSRADVAGIEMPPESHGAQYFMFRPLRAYDPSLKGRAVYPPETFAGVS